MGVCERLKVVGKVVIWECVSNEGSGEGCDMGVCEESKVAGRVVTWECVSD